MATLKNSTINDTGFLDLPAGTTAQRPAGQNGMIRFNTTIQRAEYYAVNQWVPLVIPFKLREIITTAYMAGGYASTTAWSNVNRVVAATDTTTNLGDTSLETTISYQSSACNATTMFIFGAGGGYVTSSNVITGFNMVSETRVTTGFSRAMAASRIYSGVIFKEKEFAYVSGGSSAAIERFNLSTLTIATLGSTWSTATTWGMSHENFGLFYTDESANTFNFSTETILSRGGTAPAASWSYKSVQTKINYAYAGNTNMRRSNMYTNTTSGTVSAPVSNAGEENFTMGQDHQYMLGMYNGSAQNNVSWRFNYATESGWQGTSTMEPKGKVGSSSGMCGWRA